MKQNKNQNKEKVKENQVRIMNQTNRQKEISTRKIERKKVKEEPEK